MVEEVFAEPRGTLEVRVWRYGRLIEHTRSQNLIVNRSKFVHAQLLGGMTAGNSITQIGFGSTPTAAAPGNNSLSADAYIKALDEAPTYPAANKVAFSFSLGQLEALGLNLAEYGLLTAANDLYARLVRAAPLVKDQSVSLTAVWTVTF